MVKEVFISTSKHTFYKFIMDNKDSFHKIDEERVNKFCSDNKYNCIFPEKYFIRGGEQFTIKDNTMYSKIIEYNNIYYLFYLIPLIDKDNRGRGLIYLQNLSTSYSREEEDILCLKKESYESCHYEDLELSKEDIEKDIKTEIKQYFEQNKNDIIEIINKLDYATPLSTDDFKKLYGYFYLNVDKLSDDIITKICTNKQIISYYSVLSDYNDTTIFNEDIDEFYQSYYNTLNFLIQSINELLITNGIENISITFKRFTNNKVYLSVGQNDGGITNNKYSIELFDEDLKNSYGDVEKKEQIYPFLKVLTTNVYSNCKGLDDIFILIYLLLSQIPKSFEGKLYIDDSSQYKGTRLFTYKDRLFKGKNLLYCKYGAKYNTNYILNNKLDDLKKLINKYISKTDEQLKVNISIYTNILIYKYKTKLNEKYHSLSPEYKETHKLAFDEYFDKDDKDKIINEDNYEEIDEVFKYLYSDFIDLNDFIYNIKSNMFFENIDDLHAKIEIKPYNIIGLKDGEYELPINISDYKYKKNKDDTDTLEFKNVILYGGSLNNKYLYFKQKYNI